MKSVEDYLDCTSDGSGTVVACSFILTMIYVSKTELIVEVENLLRKTGKLRLVTHPERIAELIFKWHSIGWFHFQGVPLSDAQKILRKCHSLQGCTFDQVVLAANFPYTLKLNHLVIHPNDGQNTSMVKDVFHALTLPSVSNIEVSCNTPSGRANWPQTTFIKFLSRSTPPLVHLVLKRVIITDTNLLEILAACPLLTCLVVCESFHSMGVPHLAITDKLIFGLTRHNLVTDPDLPAQIYSMVPKLSHLELEGNLLFNMDYFVNMVKSRCTPSWHVTPTGLAPQTRLQYLKLHFRHGVIAPSAYADLQMIFKKPFMELYIYEGPFDFSTTQDIPLLTNRVPSLRRFPNHHEFGQTTYPGKKYYAAISPAEKTEMDRYFNFDDDYLEGSESD